MLQILSKKASFIKQKTLYKCTTVCIGIFIFVNILINKTNKINQNNINFKKISIPNKIQYQTVPHKNKALLNKTSLIVSTLITGIISTYISLNNKIYGEHHFKKSLKYCYDKKVINNMIKDLSEINKRLGLNLELGSIETYDSNQKYIHINFINHTNKDRFQAAFNKETGKLLILRKNDNILINAEEEKVYTSAPTDFITKKDVSKNKTQLYGNISTITNLNGNLISKIEFMRSKSIKGEQEIIQQDSCDRSFKTGLAEISKNGRKHIEKTLISLDGTKTDYIYSEDIYGNSFLYYKITDSDGKILYKNTKKIKVIDDNHYISTNNEFSYDIQFTDDKIIVTKLNKDGTKTNQKVIYNIKEYSEEDYERQKKIIEESDGLFGVYKLTENYKKNGVLDNHTVDKKLIKILKKISGDEWFAMDKAGIETIRRTTYFDDNAWATNGVIELGQQEGFSTLEHEIGHQTLKSLLKDETLIKIYQEELSLCYRFLPIIELEQMDYFINNAIGFSETIAECNKIINSYNDSENFASRTLYLMKYFPRTIAYIANTVKTSS